MGKNKPSNKKIFWWIGGVFILLIGGGLILRATGVIGQNTGEVEVETATVKLKTITQLVSSSGRIQPEVEVIIRPDVSGEIIELAVKEGDFVQKGDLLVRIKPDIFQARIDELNAALLTQKARLEQTRASLIQAESVYKKNKELYEKELISELEFTQIRSDYESQQASFKASEYQVESAEAQLRRAREELDQTVIRAPQNGTVTGLSVEAGERVLGNTQMAGTEMMRVSLLDKMEVLVEVNENDIVNVDLADTARIEVDAYPERRFNGIVTEIANSARTTGAGTNEQITNYQVKVRIVTPHNLAMSGTELRRTEAMENTSDSFVPNFKPGMSATVDVETETAVNVISVPIQAVTVRDFAKDKPENNKEEEGIDDEKEPSSDILVVREDIRKVVFVVENGKAVRREVETGISDNSHVQILSGIETGDEIVIGSYRTLSKNLKDGDAVKVTEQQVIASAK